MASVNELIAAAEAQKSPFVRMMEGTATGYARAQQNALERTKTLILLEQNRLEQEKKAEAQRQMKERIYVDQDKYRDRSVMEAGVKPPPVRPQDKFDWSMNESGDYSIKSRNYEKPEKPGGMTQFYTTDEDGNPRIVSQVPGPNRMVNTTPKKVGRTTASTAEVKERQRVETVLTGLKNARRPSPLGNGQMLPLETYDDALNWVVENELDQNKHPEIMKWLETFKGKKPEPEGPSAFQRLMSGVKDVGQKAAKGISNLAKGPARYQTNSITGERRVSNDGGKTWQPVR